MTTVEHRDNALFVDLNDGASPPEGYEDAEMELSWADLQPDLAKLSGLLSFLDADVAVAAFIEALKATIPWDAVTRKQTILLAANIGRWMMGTRRADVIEQAKAVQATQNDDQRIETVS